MKIKLRFLLFFIPLVVLLGWFYIHSTPQYSLYQIRRAIISHDYEMFSKYVDIDSLVDSLIAQSLASQKSQVNQKEENEWEKMGSIVAQGLVSVMKPALKEQVKAVIKKQVESGESEEKKFLQANKPIEAFTKVQVRREGKIAKVTFPNPDGDMTDTQMVMRQKESYWQLIDMNFDFQSVKEDMGKLDTTTTKQSIVDAKFGDRTEIATGVFITVNQPEDYVPTSEWDKPETIKKFVVTDVIYENTSHEKVSLSISNLKLKDEEDHAYSYKYSGKEPKLESGDLGPGETLRGFVTFEMLKDSTIKSVIYSSSYKTIIFNKTE